MSLCRASFKRWHFKQDVSFNKCISANGNTCLNECVLCLFSPQKDLLAHSTWTCRRQPEFLS